MEKNPRCAASDGEPYNYADNDSRHNSAGEPPGRCTTGEDGDNGLIGGHDNGCGSHTRLSDIPGPSAEPPPVLRGGSEKDGGTIRIAVVTYCWTGGTAAFGLDGQGISRTGKVSCYLLVAVYRDGNRISGAVQVSAPALKGIVSGRHCLQLDLSATGEGEGAGG